MWKEFKAVHNEGNVMDLAGASSLEELSERSLPLS